jgi:hypothetical protein
MRRPVCRFVTDLALIGNGVRLLGEFGEGQELVRCRRPCRRPGCSWGGGLVPQQATFARLGVYPVRRGLGRSPGRIRLLAVCTFPAAWESNVWRAFTPRPLCRVSIAAATPGEWPPGACDQGRPA